jgi:hypothetical protein
VTGHADFHAAMPAMSRHAGVWEGTYTHVSPDGVLLDRHRTRVECLFPTSGPHAYIQRNLFTWDDGRTQSAELPGVYRDGALWWDVPTFHGKAWQSGPDLILLELHRRDVPGAWYWEMICLAPGASTRARTWHWFGPDGGLIRRTLCDEKRA